MLILPSVLFAQEQEKITLTGRVLNDLSDEPLHNVNVFIANSMLGAATDNNGWFKIIGVPFGTHELVVSTVGFEVEKITLRVVSSKDRELKIRLAPKILEVPGINVVSTKKDNWKKHLKQFKKFFLGTSRNASKCKIINPEILDFKYDSESNSFTAQANDILHIENKSLGYRLFYLLESFELKDEFVVYLAKTKFEELIPKNEKEQKKWKKNRRKTYYGSLRHFLATLTSKQVRSPLYMEKEGFLVFGLSNLAEDMSNAELEEVNFQNLTSAGELPFERKLHFFNYLQVVYTKENEEQGYIFWRMNYDKSAIGMTTQKRLEASRPQAQASWIVMNQTYTTIDTSGYLYNPLAVTVFGYWAWENVADLLPIEYSPN